jgi:hypothetical protein
MEKLIENESASESPDTFQQNHKNSLKKSISFSY